MVQVQGWISRVDQQKLKKLVKDGFYGSISDAVRMAIRQLLKEHQQDLENNSVKNPHQKEPSDAQNSDLTRDEEELLVVAAEDFWERYRHFEEGTVRKFLKTRVSTRDWPELKLNQAVEFVCSQSRKN